MASIHQEASEYATLEKMKNPAWAKILTQVVVDLNNSEYPQTYKDVIMQRWRGPYDIFDAHAFVHVHYAIKTGLLSVFQIPTGETPCADKDIEGNNAILSRLPYPFSGKFWGGTLDHDGHIAWQTPVHSVAFGRDGDDSDIELGFFIVPEMEHCPLEVGTQYSGKTYSQLCYAWNKMGGFGICLARWPYGHDRITVLTPTHVSYSSERFKDLKQRVYDDFDTCLNPWEDWWQ